MTNTATRTIDKTVNPGVIDDYDGRRKLDVFARVQYDGERLSITGVEGPKRNGDAWGSAGQICMGYAHRNPADNDPRYSSPTRIAEYAEGWTEELWFDFLDAWKRWHLNDMQAGCEHQRAEGWADRPIDPEKPTTAYGRHFEGQRQDTWNLLAWVRPDEHPDGLLTKPCPTCGYKYGTAWRRDDVPAGVLDFLESLPDTAKTPAWV